MSPRMPPPTSVPCVGPFLSVARPLFVAARIRPMLVGALAVGGLALAACAPDRGPLDARSPDLRLGTPEEVGLSSAELSRIGPTMQALVDDGRAAGIVTLVARDGVVVHWEAHGWRVLGQDPLERDDVFRIYSMTKPVTSVAIMMLVEEGSLSLDTRLDKVLPAFRNVRVFDGGVLRPASRPITLLDLLRHTSGLTYGVFGNTPVDRMYREALSPLDPVAPDLDLEATVDVVASLPLLADPGTLWNYSMSTDVLGRVVEVVSGTTLDAFFRTRIFEPLGMRHTGFHVRARDLDDFTGVYARGPDGLRMTDSPVDGRFTRPAVWYSGGGGLTSTPEDYLRFAQMLLQEGELDGMRILRAETVRAMRTNHLPETLMPIRLGGPVADHGFGLGFAVAVGGPREGQFWWAGVANTWFWIDPVERIIGFAWTQYEPFGGIPVDPLLREIVRASIIESNRAVLTAAQSPSQRPAP